MHAPNITVDVTSSLSIDSVQFNLNKVLNNSVELHGNFHVALNASLISLDYQFFGGTGGFKVFTGLRVQPLIDAAMLGRSTGVVLYQQINDSKFKTFCSKLHSYVSDEGRLSVEIAVAMPKALEYSFENRAMNTDGCYFALVGKDSKQALERLNLFRGNNSFVYLPISSYAPWYYVQTDDLLKYHLDTLFVSVPVAVAAPIVKAVEAPITTLFEKNDFIKELTQLYHLGLLEKKIVETLDAAKAFLRKSALSGEKQASLNFEAATKQVVICSGGIIYSLFPLTPVWGSTHDLQLVLWKAYEKVIPFSIGPNLWAWAN